MFSIRYKEQDLYTNKSVLKHVSKGKAEGGDQHSGFSFLPFHAAARENKRDTNLCCSKELVLLVERSLLLLPIAPESHTLLAEL